TFRAYRRVRGRAAWTPKRRRSPPEEVEELPEEDSEPVPAQAPPRAKPAVAPKPPPLPKPTSRPAPAPSPAPVPPQTVSVTCPKCGKRLRVSAETARTKFECPNPGCDAIIDASRHAG